MANFTEIATLKVNDLSSSTIMKIDRALRGLQRTSAKMRGMPRMSDFISQANAGGFRAQTRAVNDLTKAYGRLSQAARNAGRFGGGGMGGIGGMRVPSGTLRDLSQMNSMLRQMSRYRTFRIDARFPRNIGPALNRLTGFDAAYGIRNTVREGARAIGDTSEQNVIEDIQNLSPQQRKQVADVTERISSRIMLQDRNGLRMMARTLAVGLREGEDLEAATMSISKGIGAVSFMKGRENGQRFGEQVAKAIDRSGHGMTSNEVQMFADAAAKAQVISEKDLNFTQVLNGVRRLGRFAQTLDPTAFGDFIMDVDAAGLQASNNLRTFMNDMTRSNLNKKTKARLQKVGLGQGGTLKDAELFYKNPADWINKYMRPMLEKQGVGMTDEVAVNKALDKTFGLNASATNFVATALTQWEQIQRDRAKRDRIDMDKVMDVADKSIVGSLQSVQAGWRNLASSFTNWADGAAPIFAEFGRGLDDLSRGNVSYRAVRGVAGGGLVAAAGAAVSHPEIAALGFAAWKLGGAGASLTGAAAALTGAARVQAAGGLGGGIVGGNPFRSAAAAAAGGAATGGLARGLWSATRAAGMFALRAGVFTAGVITLGEVAALAADKLGLLPKEAEKLSGAFKLYALGGSGPIEKEFPKLAQMNKALENETPDWLKGKAARASTPGTAEYQQKQQQDANNRAIYVSAEIKRLTDERNYWRGKAERGEIAQAPFKQADAEREKKIMRLSDEQRHMPMPPVRPEDINNIVNRITDAPRIVDEVMSTMMTNTSASMMSTANTAGDVIAAKILGAFRSVSLPQIPVSVTVSGNKGPDTGTATGN